MNINQIKAKPVNSGPYFKDYPVPMKLVVEEPHIKNWINNLQRGFPPEQLPAVLREEGGAYVRVRHFEDGLIREMEISQNGNGSLCCMAFTHEEDWPEIVKMIESESKDKGLVGS